MNRKERRAAKFKAPRPSLRQLAMSLCMAAPWCIRTRWPVHYAPSIEMCFAGKEVFRRHLYAADMASCILMVRNAATTLCIGDKRAGYDVLARRGSFKHLPPYEEWQSNVSGDGKPHVVLKARDGENRAFLDPTFGQVAIKTKGAIQVPPAFAGFGNIEWPSTEIDGVWFGYAEAPQPPELGNIKASDWSGLIDDLDTLVGIALGCGNDGRAFDMEMERQMRLQGR